MGIIIGILLAAGVAFAFYKFFTHKSKETPTGGVGVTPTTNPGDENKPD